MSRQPGPRVVAAAVLTVYGGPYLLRPMKLPTLLLAFMTAALPLLSGCAPWWSKTPTGIQKTRIAVDAWRSRTMEKPNP